MDNARIIGELQSHIGVQRGILRNALDRCTGTEDVRRDRRTIAEAKIDALEDMLEFVREGK